MALYNLIRDFFVEQVWGGTLSNGYARGTGVVGKCLLSSGSTQMAKLNDTYIASNLYHNPNGELLYINLGDWLSTTSTIITLVIILVVISIFIRWIFKVVSNSILLR